MESISKYGTVSLLKGPLRVLGCLALTALISGCSMTSASSRSGSADASYDNVDADGNAVYPRGGGRLPEGVAQYVWEEPMVDVVEVPPGLDPEGHYYRPAHREVVEVRQGRWQHYQEPQARSNQ